MASKLYRQLLPQKGLQQRMTGKLIQWLKKGLALAEAVQRLMDAYFPKQEPLQQTASTMYRTTAVVENPVNRLRAIHTPHWLHGL